MFLLKLPNWMLAGIKWFAIVLLPYSLYRIIGGDMSGFVFLVVHCVLYGFFKPLGAKEYYETADLLQQLSQSRVRKIEDDVQLFATAAIRNRHFIYADLLVLRKRKRHKGKDTLGIKR